MKQPIRLGIVGSGNMASRMVKALCHTPDYKVQAVASGSVERAQAFAAAFDIPGSFASAKELAENSEIDAVYICSRNRDHVAHAMAAIEAGKPTLVEKPLATTLDDAIKLVETARQKGVLLVENLWCLALPAYRQLRDWNVDQTFGKPVQLQFSFGYPATATQYPSLFSPEDGGVLLDRAIYGVSLALQLLGPVRGLHTSATLDENGVDLSVDLGLEHASGASSQLAVSFEALMSNTATLSFSGGFVRLEAPVVGSESIYTRQAFVPAEDSRANGIQMQSSGLKDRLKSNAILRKIKRLKDSNAARFMSYGPDQYTPMLRHFRDLVRGEKTESDLASLALSLDGQKILEQARQHIRGNQG